jgi:hypothetical protein
MNFENWMRQGALFASYLYELRACASHAERLALLRLARHRAEFEAKHALEQERDRLHAVLDEFAQLEQRVPGASRALVQGALRAWAAMRSRR